MPKCLHVMSWDQKGRKDVTPRNQKKPKNVKSNLMDHNNNMNSNFVIWVCQVSSKVCSNPAQELESRLHWRLERVHLTQNQCVDLSTRPEAVRSDTYVSSRLSLPLSFSHTHGYTHTWHTHCYVRLESRWIPLPHYASALVSDSCKTNSYFTLSGKQLLKYNLQQ